MVARSWHRDCLEEILSTPREVQTQITPSPYLCLPLMSIIKIARDCGWRNCGFLPTCQDPCVVCLERKCSVAAEGCCHEFCTHCALYLCSMNNTSPVARGPAGSISCPLCRHGITSFVKLPGTRPIMKEITRSTLSLSSCGCSCDCMMEGTSLMTPVCKPYRFSDRIPPLRSSLCSLSCKSLTSVTCSSSLCMGAATETSCSIMPASSVGRSLRHQLSRCRGSSFRRASSNAEGRSSWFCPLNQYVAASAGGGGRGG